MVLSEIALDFSYLVGFVVTEKEILGIRENWYIRDRWTTEMQKRLAETKMRRAEDFLLGGEDFVALPIPALITERFFSKHDVLAKRIREADDLLYKAGQEATRLREEMEWLEMKQGIFILIMVLGLVAVGICLLIFWRRSRKALGRIVLRRATMRDRGRR